MTIGAKGGYNIICYTGCGSVWLERVVWDHEAAGSNPVTPMIDLIPEVRCLCDLRDFCYRKNHPDFWLPLVTLVTLRLLSSRRDFASDKSMPV